MFCNSTCNFKRLEVESGVDSMYLDSIQYFQGNYPSKFLYT